MQKIIPGRPGKGQRKSYLGTTAEGLKGGQPIPDSSRRKVKGVTETSKGPGQERTAADGGLAVRGFRLTKALADR